MKVQARGNQVKDEESLPVLTSFLTSVFSDFTSGDDPPSSSGTFRLPLVPAPSSFEGLIPC